MLEIRIFLLTFIKITKVNRSFEMTHILCGEYNQTKGKFCFSVSNIFLKKKKKKLWVIFME